MPRAPEIEMENKSILLSDALGSTLARVLDADESKGVQLSDLLALGLVSILESTLCRYLGLKGRVDVGVRGVASAPASPKYGSESPCMAALIAVFHSPSLPASLVVQLQ